MARGHGVDQRAVGDVNRGVAHREQQIGAERPGDFYPHAGIGHGKRQNADNADRHGNPQLPGTKAPPAALGTVGQHAHDRIGNGVKNAQGQKQGSDQRGRQAEDIGIEKSQKVHDQAGNHRPARVAKSVAYFFP